MVQQFDMDDVPSEFKAEGGQHGLGVVCDEGGAAEERTGSSVSRTPVRSYEAGEMMASSPFDSDLLMRKLKRAANRGSAGACKEDEPSSPFDSFLLSSKQARFLGAQD